MLSHHGLDERSWLSHKDPTPGKKALKRGKSSVLGVGALSGTAWELAGKKLIQGTRNCLSRGWDLLPKCPQGYFRKCGVKS